MAEDRRTPDRGAARQRELDAQVEELTRQIADLVNSAGVESGQHLCEYAVDLRRVDAHTAALVREIGLIRGPAWERREYYSGNGAGERCGTARRAVVQGTITLTPMLS